MKRLAAVLLLVSVLGLAMAPPAAADARTDAALALGAFAVFNQLARGETVLHGFFAPRPVVVAPPPPVVYAPPPPPVVYAPAPVVVPAPPVVVAPRPVVVVVPRPKVVHSKWAHGVPYGHWKKAGGPKHHHGRPGPPHRRR